MTDNCKNNDLGKKLYAYELGLLSEDELDEFETHLLECSYCYNEVKEFKKASQVILSDEEIKSDLKKSINEIDTEKVVGISKPQERKKWNNWLKVSIVAAAIVIILILNPWKIEFQPSQEAIARENLLAIMYFENFADPTDSLMLGEITTNLLITDLTESQYVQVVSSQRLYDLLKLLGHEGEKKINKSIATQVARKADARWMLSGSILQIEPTIMITSQLIDMEPGRVLASQRIDGEPGDNIFSLVDKLSLRIKTDLSLPPEALSEPDPQVANVTTNSLDAYRYYLNGMENRFKFYDSEAEKSFRRALEFDSTLAMAYFWLVDYTFGEEQERFKNKAIQYSENAGRKEKLFISVLNSYCKEDWDEYLRICEEIVKIYPDEKIVYWSMAVINNRMLGRPDKAIVYLNKVIELDPLYRIAYNDLAYAYDDMGDHEKAIQTINRYIEIAPDEANPYDTRGDLYSYYGNISNAIESYKKALSIKPDFHGSIIKLANMYLFRQDYFKADSLYRIVAAGPTNEIRTLGRCYLARIPLFQGKFNEALEKLKAYIEVDRIETANNRFLAENLFTMAFIYAYHLDDVENAAKFYDQAVVLRQMIDIEGATEYWDNLQLVGFSEKFSLALYYAHNGNSAEADAIMKEVYSSIDTADNQKLRKYWNSVAQIEFERGNYDSALSIINSYPIHDSTFMNLIFQARLYNVVNLPEDAVRLYEKLLMKYDKYRAWNTSFAVLLHYWTGLAYENAEWYDEAIEQYEIFLDIWKNADPGIEEIEDARERLKYLLSKTS